MASEGAEPAPLSRRKLILACQHMVHGMTGVLRVFDEGEAWRVSLYVPRSAKTVDRFSAPLAAGQAVDRDAVREWALSLLQDVRAEDVDPGGAAASPAPQHAIGSVVGVLPQGPASSAGLAAPPPDRGLDAARRHRLRAVELATEGRLAEAEAVLRDSIRCWSIYAAARLSLVTVLLRMRNVAATQREALATVSTVRRLQARARRAKLQAAGGTGDSVEDVERAARVGACAETEGAPLGRVAAAAYSFLARAYATEARFPRAVNAMVLALREARVTVLGSDAAGSALELYARGGAARAVEALRPTGEAWADSYTGALQQLLSRQALHARGQSDAAPSAPPLAPGGCAESDEAEAAPPSAEAEVVAEGGEAGVMTGAGAVRDVEDLVSRHWLLPAAGALRFHCTACGQCCRSADHIFLHPLDLWSMSRSPALRAARGVGSTSDLHAAFGSALHRSARLGAPLLSLRPVQEARGRCAFSFPLYKEHGSGRLLSFVEVEDRGLNRGGGRGGGGGGGGGVAGLSADVDADDDGQVPYVRAQPHEYMLTESDLEDAEETGEGGAEAGGEGSGGGGAAAAACARAPSPDDRSDGDSGSDSGSDSDSDSTAMSAPPPPYEAAVAGTGGEGGAPLGDGAGDCSGGVADAASDGDGDEDGDAVEMEEDEAALEGLMPRIDVSSGDDEGEAEEERALQRRRKAARSSATATTDASPLYNTFGTPALGCALGVAHMPTLCASYPVARELSWAEFWRAGVPSEDAHANFVVVASDECEGFRDDALERAEGVWGVPAGDDGDGDSGDSGGRDESDAGADASDGDGSACAGAEVAGGRASPQRIGTLPSVAGTHTVGAFLSRAGVAPRWREHDWFLRECVGVVCASPAVGALQPYPTLSRMLARVLWMAWYDFDHLPAARSRPLTAWPAARALVAGVTARAVAALERGVAPPDSAAVGAPCMLLGPTGSPHARPCMQRCVWPFGAAALHGRSKAQATGRNCAWARRSDTHSVATHGSMRPPSMCLHDPRARGREPRALCGLPSRPMA